MRQRTRRVLTVIGSLVTVGLFLVVAFVPREVCGCISPNMRFRGLFGTSATEHPERVRAAMLARLPAGTDAAALRAACAEINRSVGATTACTFDQPGAACACAFRTQSSVLGWRERSVKLRFETGPGDKLTDVAVERTSSLF